MKMNPYQDLAAVRNPQMFFGRSRILRRLYAAIANLQCISLIGPRHIGKSSILMCISLPKIQEQYSVDLSRHLLIMIDLREFLHKSVEDFFEGVSQQIIAQSQQRLNLAAHFKAGKDGFSSLLDQINDQGFHPVLLLDAFDNIARNQQFDLAFFAFLRAEARKVSYVTASIAPLNQICHSDIQGSPFFNIFGVCPVELFTAEEARALATEPAIRAGQPFNEQQIEWLLRYGGRHPFFLQRLCHFLFEEKSLAEDGEVDLRQVRGQAYKELLPHFEDAWERLSERERESLKDEAQRKVNPQRALPELSESGLFRQFVREKYQVHLYQITAKDIEDILDNLDDTQYLGASDLRHLQIVADRFQRSNNITTVEKGLAVRQALSEAFERLRGNGVRRDADPAWKHYNILHYRYFKNHLKNEQIAARLDFSSTRQYFRERNKAIEALYNALMDMEAAANRGESE